MKTYTLFNNIMTVDAGTSMCLDGKVRLVGGDSEREEQVEM